MKELLMILGVIGIVVAGVIYEGLVFQVMWEWFIVSTFNLPSISIPAAIGIGFASSLITHQYVDNSSEKSAAEKFGAVIGFSLLKPTVVLFGGWITTYYL